MQFHPLVASPFNLLGCPCCWRCSGLAPPTPIQDKLLVNARREGTRQEGGNKRDDAGKGTRKRTRNVKECMPSELDTELYRDPKPTT
jgi:hypothetical protein